MEALAVSAADNIPGVDFVSITVHRKNRPMHTVAATDPVAEQADRVQYELHEGPCYAAVTHERFVLVNDLATAVEFPRYAPKAVALGVGSPGRHPAAPRRRAGWAQPVRPHRRSIRPIHGTDRRALRHPGRSPSWVRRTVEQLSEALHTRTDIGTAIGILMERYGIDRHQAFAFLTHNSQTRNIKVRVLAQRIIEGTFESTAAEDRRSRNRS